MSGQGITEAKVGQTATRVGLYCRETETERDIYRQLCLSAFSLLSSVFSLLFSPLSTLSLYSLSLPHSLYSISSSPMPHPLSAIHCYDDSNSQLAPVGTRSTQLAVDGMLECSTVGSRIHVDAGNRHTTPAGPATVALPPPPSMMSKRRRHLLRSRRQTEV